MVLTEIPCNYMIHHHIYTYLQGRNNMFQAILLFLHRIMVKNHGMLGWVFNILYQVPAIHKNYLVSNLNMYTFKEWPFWFVFESLTTGFIVCEINTGPAGMGN